MLQFNSLDPTHPGQLWPLPSLNSPSVPWGWGDKPVGKVPVVLPVPSLSVHRILVFSFGPIPKCFSFLLPPESFYLSLSLSFSPLVSPPSLPFLSLNSCCSITLPFRFLSPAISSKISSSPFPVIVSHSMATTLPSLWLHQQIPATLLFAQSMQQQSAPGRETNSYPKLSHKTPHMWVFGHTWFLVEISFLRHLSVFSYLLLPTVWDKPKDHWDASLSHDTPHSIAPHPFINSNPLGPRVGASDFLEHHRTLQHCENRVAAAGVQETHATSIHCSTDTNLLFHQTGLCSEGCIRFHLAIIFILKM